MTEQHKESASRLALNLEALWPLWVRDLSELDAEIARLASMCGVRILEPGVIERVLQKDESVCGTPNPAAFTKLWGLLSIHFLELKRSITTVGASKTSLVETAIVERLKQRFPELAQE